MVTLTSPFADDIKVTKEQAEKILAHPLNQNPTSQWAIKEKKDAIGATVNDNPDSTAPKKPARSSGNKEGG